MLLNMTEKERELLSSLNFNDLWKHVWSLSNKDYTMDELGNIKILNNSSILVIDYSEFIEDIIFHFVSFFILFSK
jgi:hypothetical protein